MPPNLQKRESKNMSVEVKPKVTHETMDLASALEFLKRYHPGFWDRVNEQDIADILKVSHSLFKTRPDLLEATTNTRFTPLQ